MPLILLIFGQKIIEHTLHSNFVVLKIKEAKWNCENVDNVIIMIYDIIMNNDWHQLTHTTALLIAGDICDSYSDIAIQSILCEIRKEKWLVK